jgi:lipopolysaccharide export LptBFGC system permease protein LptF
MKHFYVCLLFIWVSNLVSSQNNSNLEYFINRAKENIPSLHENDNLIKIGELQNSIITAQNKAFQVNATSDVLFAPYFNNNGKIIDVTTAPSANAFGYDVGITNGGLRYEKLISTQY